MDDASRSANFALKRAQAQRNVESHIAKSLFSAAKSIVAASAAYRTNKTLARKREFERGAQRITQEVQQQVEAYIKAYAEASLKVLGIDGGVVDDYLAGKIFGKTFIERNRAYIKTFASDIVRMVRAGVMMGYTQEQILSAIRTGYKEPFKSSVITKAQRKRISIDTPSYGKGIYHSSYQNIIRNAKATIALAWGQAEREYGERGNAIGFRVFRGSSYPCATCDDECAYIHKMDDPMPPFHVSCVCRVEFIYEEKKE